MSQFQYRVTGICSANLRSAMNAIGQALGHGGGGFDLALYTKGGDTITHYATSTVATSEFIGFLTDKATQDAILASIDWTGWGFEDEAEVRLILEDQNNANPPRLAIGPTSDKARDQLAHLLDANNLSVDPTEPVE